MVDIVKVLLFCTPSPFGPASCSQAVLCWVAGPRRASHFLDLSPLSANRDAAGGLVVQVQELDADEPGAYLSNCNLDLPPKDKPKFTTRPVSNVASAPNGIIALGIAHLALIQCCSRQHNLTALHNNIIIMAAAHTQTQTHTFHHTAVLSDTSHDSSDLPSAIPPPPHHQGDHRTARPGNPPVSVRTRTETLSSITSTSSTSSSPVRRKPLPSTASPLATRFSSGEHLATNLQPPDQPYVRPYSVDSPTLHDFPPTSKLPFSPAEHTAQSFSRYIAFLHP